MGNALKDLTREELEAEVVRLRKALEDAGVNPQHPAEMPINCSDAELACGTAASATPSVQDSSTALASSETRQQAIFESAIDIAMIVTSPDGVITDWNPGAELVLGWTAEEMLGHTAERFFTPADRASGQIEREMRYETGAPWMSVGIFARVIKSSGHPAR